MKSPTATLSIIKKRYFIVLVGSIRMLLMSGGKNWIRNELWNHLSFQTCYKCEHTVAAVRGGHWLKKSRRYRCRQH